MAALLTIVSCGFCAGVVFAIFLVRYTRLPDLAGKLFFYVTALLSTIRLERQNLSLRNQDAIKLRRRVIRPLTWSVVGEASDMNLLRQMKGEPFRNDREKRLESAWHCNFENLVAYQQSVEPNRKKLQAYLGQFHEDAQGKIINEKQVVLPGFGSVKAFEATYCTIQSRLPHLSFGAYLVKPVELSPLNKIGVVAIHGHGSSAARMAGMEVEDYSRKMALRLAEYGFTVIVPNVTSDRAISNAISAHASIYGYTLYGMMAQFVQSCLDVLYAEAGVEKAGTYGLSNGALISLFASALDNRIKFSVNASHSFSFYERNLRPCGFGGEYRNYAYYFQGPLWSEFDIVHLATLCVPAILIFSSGTYDEGTEEWEREYAKVQSVYEKLGMKDRIGKLLFRGYHEAAEGLDVEMLISKLPFLEKGHE